MSPHEVGLEEVAAVAVVLELALVQLHREIGGLKVQGDELAARVPENLQRENANGEMEISREYTISSLSFPFKKFFAGFFS